MIQYVIYSLLIIIWSLPQYANTVMISFGCTSISSCICLVINYNMHVAPLAFASKESAMLDVLIKKKNVHVSPIA